MTLTEYIVFALSSLFVIIDPITLVPVFLAMTPMDTPQQRIKTARLACFIAAVVMLSFASVGKWIFKFFGITEPAFEMAGSIVLLLIALDMLRAKRSPVRETTEETDAGTMKEDVAVTPLAVPMMAGPGAISTIVLLHSKARGIDQTIALDVCVVIVCLTSYLIFRWSAHGAKWLNPIAMRVATRLMGLLLAAIAFQFLINALSTLKGTIF
jgi:multiple antibiotic resistance protein